MLNFIILPKAAKYLSFFFNFYLNLSYIFEVFDKKRVFFLIVEIIIRKERAYIKSNLILRFKINLYFF